jgi:hypothetical protein
MDIGEAIHHLKQGRAVTRPGWNGNRPQAGDTAPGAPSTAPSPRMWIALQAANPSRRRLGYVVLKTASGELVPWLASQSDLLADDWVVVHPGDTKLAQPTHGPLPAVLIDRAAAALAGTHPLPDAELYGDPNRPLPA